MRCTLCRKVIGHLVAILLYKMEDGAKGAGIPHKVCEFCINELTDNQLPEYDFEPIESVE